MTELLLQIAFAILAAALLLGFYRLAKGPTAVDRILAFDAVVLCAVAMTVLLSRWWQSAHYMELILIVSTLGFFGAVAFVLFLQRSMPYGGGEESEESENKEER